MDRVVDSMILLPVQFTIMTAMLLSVSAETYASNSSVLSQPESQSEGIFDILGGSPFEHLVEIDANQIFPNDSLKHEIVSKSGSFEFTMPMLNYDLLGFNISASDIEVNANAEQVIYEGDQSMKTRVDFPVMLAGSVNVTNKIISQKYENVDLSSVYAFYDPETDKFTFHVPFEIAARFLFN